MGLKRRFQNLLRGNSRSASQTRCQRQCCQHQHPETVAASADHQPQLGRRGPTANTLHHSQSQHQPQQQHQSQQSLHQQKLRDRQLSRSCERRGNHYASLSTASSTSSTSSSSSSIQAGHHVQQPPQNLWRPAQLNNFVRLEAAEASCYVAELSSSFSASSGSSAGSSGSGAPVYEEIPDPLYDRVAASADHSDEAECDPDELCSVSRYWIYSSLPRQHRKRCRPSREAASAPAQSQAQCHLPLGLTHVDWRGVKCTSF